jgi:hypothetical protein
MGVNHGSAVSLRIKRQAKIVAKSLDLKRYNNFSAETRLLGSKRLSAGNDEAWRPQRAAASMPSHCQGFPVRQGYCIGIKLQFVRVIVTTEL